MAKKIEHTIFRNQKLFCTHCGGEQAVALPIEITIMTAMITAFNKIHKSCPKTWEQPTIPLDRSQIARELFWLNHGERGSSSEFMYHVLCDPLINFSYAHPYDAGDFKRCHGLLEIVPELRGKLYLMAGKSEIWDNLVKHWDQLTQMLKKEIAEGPGELTKFMYPLINLK
jgi:hypothetical protein